MKKIALLVLAVVLFRDAVSQCRDIKYDIPTLKDYTADDSIVFYAKNHCSKNKYVLFSLEYKDSTGWREIDNDIFTPSLNGMNIIKLVSKKSQRFNFKIISIDPFFSKQRKKDSFRIVENLYAADKIQIIQVRAVKFFLVDYEK